MGLRVALLSLLLASAALGSARAQDAEAAPDAGVAQEPGAEQEPGAAPDAGAAAPDAAAGTGEVPAGAGYEPDQRGAIDDQLSGMIPEASPPAGAPMELEGAADVSMEALDREPAPEPMIYLELQNGYSYLDPSALMGDGAAGLGDAEAQHGYTIGVAAGLHLGDVDAGLRFTHGFHLDGVDLNALAIEARLDLLEGEVVPQLRLAAGLLVLSDIEGAMGADVAQRGTLVGASLEPGIGVYTMLGKVLSLGAALDASFSRTGSVSVDAAGIELRVHVDLGIHF